MPLLSEQHVRDLAERIREVDIIAVTHNGNRYDIPILDQEFKRAGVKCLSNSKAHLTVCEC